MDPNTVTRAQLRAIVQDIDDAYVKLLLRNPRPDTKGLANWLHNRIWRGTTAQQMRRTMRESREYKRKHPVKPSVDPFRSRSLFLVEREQDTVNTAAFPINMQRARFEEYKRLCPWATHIDLGWCWNAGDRPANLDKFWIFDIDKSSHQAQLRHAIELAAEFGLIVNFWCFADDDPPGNRLNLSQRLRKIDTFERKIGFENITGLIIGDGIEPEEWIESEAAHQQLLSHVVEADSDIYIRVLSHTQSGRFRDRDFWEQFRENGGLGIAAQVHKLDDGRDGFTTSPTLLRQSYAEIRNLGLERPEIYYAEGVFLRPVADAVSLADEARRIGFYGSMAG